MRRMLLITIFLFGVSPLNILANQTTDILEEHNIFDTMYIADPVKTFYVDFTLRGELSAYAGKVSIRPGAPSSLYTPSLGFLYRNYQESGKDVIYLSLEAQLVKDFTNINIYYPYGGFGQGYAHWQIEQPNNSYDGFGSLVTYAFLGVKAVISPSFHFFAQYQVRAYWQKYRVEKGKNKEGEIFKSNLQYGFTVSF